MTDSRANTKPSPQRKGNIKYDDHLTLSKTITIILVIVDLIIMAPRANIFDYAQRATSFGLLGLGVRIDEKIDEVICNYANAIYRTFAQVWGLWLTAAVWKSRRGEQGVS